MQCNVSAGTMPYGGTQCETQGTSLGRSNSITSWQPFLFLGLLLYMRLASICVLLFLKGCLYPFYSHFDSVWHFLLHLYSVGIHIFCRLLLAIPLRLGNTFIPSPFLSTFDVCVLRDPPCCRRCHFPQIHSTTRTGLRGSARWPKTRPQCVNQSIIDRTHRTS